MFSPLRKRFNSNIYNILFINQQSMFCNKCDTEISTNSNFCQNCGSNLTIFSNDTSHSDNIEVLPTKIDKNKVIKGIKQFIVGVTAGLLIIGLFVTILIYGGDFLSNNLNIDILSPLSIFFEIFASCMIIIGVYNRIRNWFK